jgi:hypothetical protein
MALSRSFVFAGFVLRLAAASMLVVSAAHAADLIFANDFDPEEGPGPTQTCTINPDASGFFTLNGPGSSAVVRLPPGYDAGNPTPQRLLIALHGCGDTALNFATWAAVPFALRASQNYIGAALGGRDGQCWSLGTDAPLVTAAIANIRSCFYVHRRRSAATRREATLPTKSQ